jgi:hypothetical protein
MDTHLLEYGGHAVPKAFASAATASETSLFPISKALRTSRVST